jgi:hypothetical protein
MSYSVSLSGGFGGGSVQLSGQVVNMTDVGSSPTGPVLFTQLPRTGAAATITQVRCRAAWPLVPALTRYVRLALQDSSTGVLYGTTSELFVASSTS